MLVTLTGAWLASVVISSPIAFGMNYTDSRRHTPHTTSKLWVHTRVHPAHPEFRRHTPHICTFYNSYFLIFSSMGSFYIPCVAMLALYWKMFRTIRQRARQSLLRRRQTRHMLNADTPARDDVALNVADKKLVRARETFINT